MRVPMFDVLTNRILERGKDIHRYGIEAETGLREFLDISEIYASFDERT